MLAAVTEYEKGYKMVVNLEKMTASYLAEMKVVWMAEQRDNEQVVSLVYGLADKMVVSKVAELGT